MPVNGKKESSFDEGFDGFPVLSNHGRKLVWASNRHGKNAHEINILFVAWI
jgi:hypothetical protein